MDELFTLSHQLMEHPWFWVSSLGFSVACEYALWRWVQEERRDRRQQRERAA